MKKRFELFLLKNTLAIAMPAVAVFLVLIFFLFRYPIFEKLECNDIGAYGEEGEALEDKLSALSDKETFNISIEQKNLYYTGFDYYADNKKKGSYYYAIEDEKLHIFLLSEEHEGDVLDSIKIKAKIVKDSVSTNHIFNQLSQSNGIANLSDTGFYSDFIVSELDYPTSYIRLVYLFYATPIVICGIILLYTALICIDPKIHSQSRQLAAYGKTKKVINQINRELREDYVYKKGNIYITTNYALVSYLVKTDVIRLDMVKYISKNEVEKKLAFGKKRTIYRLTLASPEVLFYEVDFYDEASLDDVMDYIETMKV